MNIYLLTQEKKNNYDTYDSCVVIAESENAARNMHPSNGSSLAENPLDKTWVSDPNDVNVTLIGRAINKHVREVVCASFNAG